MRPTASFRKSRFRRQHLLPHFSGSSSLKSVWAFLVALALSSCTRLSDCVNTVLSEVASPSGQFVATAFERDCGATTAKNTQASLRQRSEPFTYEKQTSFLIFEGSGNVVLSWKSETNLVVRLPSDAKIFRQEQNQLGIKIDYAQ